MPSFRFPIAALVCVVAVTGCTTAAMGEARQGSISTTSHTIPSTTSTSTSTLTTTTSKTSITTTTVPTLAELVIHGAGDVNLDPSYNSALGENGYDYAWVGLDGLFQEDHLTVVNLECAPSDLGVAEPKEFVFRCPTESLRSLVAAGVDVANLGNNHSGDYGKSALVDGRDQLGMIGVAPVGAGADVDEAGEPALFDIGGWSVAVVGFGGIMPHDGWIATEDQAGMRDGDDIPSMVAAVEHADALADIVIVTIHWGVELDTEPRPDDIERADAMIAAGADVIFGHHAHRLQPFEMVNDAAVFWGLGNFVWPRQSDAGATTAVARVVVRSDGTLDACLIPAFIENSGQPVLTGEPDCGPNR